MLIIKHNLNTLLLFFSLILGRILIMRENTSSEFPTKQDLNQSPQLQRLTITLKFTCSNKCAQQRCWPVNGCAGWSAPLLFANPEDMVSPDAQMMRVNMTLKLYISICIKPIHYHHLLLTRLAFKKLSTIAWRFTVFKKELYSVLLLHLLKHLFSVFHGLQALSIFLF